MGYRWPHFPAQGSPVTAVRDDVPCAACGGRHTLGLSDCVRSLAHRDFTYTCPRTGRVVHVRIDAWYRLGGGWRDGTVTLWPGGG
jgi:hypothetical protein